MLQVALADKGVSYHIHVAMAFVSRQGLLHAESRLCINNALQY
jgi:hypothetical protein